jgi:hypothetical protein
LRTPTGAEKLRAQRADEIAAARASVERDREAVAAERRAFAQRREQAAAQVL